MATAAQDESSASRRDQFDFDSDHLLTFCERFNEAENVDSSESLLEVKLKDLESRWGRVEASYECLMMSKDKYFTSTVKKEVSKIYEECAQSYYICSSKMIDIMKSFRLETMPYPTGQSTSRFYLPNQRLSQDFQQDNSNCIKLPPCDTEVFKGSYEQWPSFRDMFTAVYINHTRLTPVTKLYHLRNKTRDEAGDIVKRYPLSNENFDLAWNALKLRYENKRVLVDNQLKIIFDIPAATREDSEAIRKIQSTVNDSLATLKTLGVHVDSWDPILIRLISTKLPHATLSLWEQSLTSPRELPQWSQMSQFLIDRYETVERVNSIKTTKDCFTLTRAPQTKVQTYVSQENLSPTQCKLCSLTHSLRACPKFKAFSVQQRVDYVFKNKFCNNCLAASHLKSNCGSKNKCLHCKKSHHTLLHMRQSQQPMPHSSTKLHSENGKVVQKSYANTTQTVKNPTLNDLPSSSSQIHANCSTSSENILLRTALTQIEHRGELFTVRALIDPGSQRTFLTERIRARLQLPYEKAHYEVVGIGGQKQIANKECQFVLYAKRYNVRVPVKAIILSKVTKQLPACNFEVPCSEELAQIDLADPNFNKAAQIDLILGNDCEHFLNIEGIKKNICGQTSAYNTIFGWVLSGPIKTQSIQTFTTSVFVSEAVELNNILKKFWEQEEVPGTRPKSAEDEFCENLYSQTTTRGENGRYIVRLPFKADFPEAIYLGSSRFTALAQYSSLERNLCKDPELQAQYKEVLNEYVIMNHMEEIPPNELVSHGKYGSYYLPHHAVIRPEHKTTRLRVVFNASRKSKSQKSLNDVLYTGPTLQNDLTSILINWRKYKYVFNGDIQKMYRQILVHPADRSYQRIVFQPQADGPIKDYQLKTVTFGVNCAPYLAIRTLLQLASDSESRFPSAASILRTETYVDDILSGGYSIKETLAAQTQLIEVLNSAGFPLKKITANDPQLLAHLSKEDLYDSDFLRFHDSSTTKTLGIKWNAISDSFSYNFSPIEQTEKITKRQILASVAKLFDPAGWLAPIVIRAKTLMQQLWLKGLNWDEEVSDEILNKWNSLVQDLAYIDTISIPRWLQSTVSDSISIHGFSDASETAFCATVYIRCQSTSHTIFTNLLVAKSKVAPIQTVCLPRLELNGAVLLANLVSYVLNSLNLEISTINLWTDSSIVLGWLSKPPSTWQTYVANRIAQIHRQVPNGNWHHVPTHDNPADLGTRGCKPQELAHNFLWWHGPSWLMKPSSEWPKRNPLKIVEDSKKHTVALHTEVQENDILYNFSSYNRALRVVCYIFRFFNECLAKCPRISRATKVLLSRGNITLNEMKTVKTRLIVLAQMNFFKEEYKLLLNAQSLATKSALHNLNPFIDGDSVLRANGRLAHASLPYNERHPIILPGNSQFCHLYLSFVHKLLAHAECNQMCRMVQSEFYIFRLKPRVKSIIRQCKVCTIHRQQGCSQIMAPLPKERCILTPPFHTTGVDFAGPFELKASTLRKASTIKGYVSVFVCFSTKAIHLEACSDLSSKAFQAAFARFVGRRGLPQRVTSDNGRNFLGASRALEREFSKFVKESAQDIAQKYVTQGFEWRFIPPHAPHMGGLWEAAVKSFKFHFKRIAGTQKFTFEEFSTVLARIEGILNSRPISALSEDPSDLTALTPGHFLRGSPMMAFPEPDCGNLSTINRWQKLKALHHQFSIRWKEEYLKALHKRYKWRTSTPNIQIGDLVVVKDDLLPPQEWRLGRVEKTYPGTDGHVRTADVRIASGVITRPIVKLCFLPYQQTQNS